jgi:NAD+ synthase
MNYKTELEYLNTVIKEYFKETNKAILGISGGADSTIVAMLLVKAIGAKNVYGIMMPNGNQVDIADSRYICQTLKIHAKEVNIAPAYQGIANNETMDIELSKVAKINIAPRIRMTTLYAIGQTLGARVVGTGNGSELYIGWCTKHGDMAYDKLAPLGPYTKIEVVEMGKLLAMELFDINSEEYTNMLALITKVPTDGLTGKSDEENIGFTYQQLHDFQRKGSSGNPEIDEKIERMHQTSEHKRDQSPVPKTTSN